MSGSCWDASSFESKSEMPGIETESTKGSEGMFIPSSSSNGSCDDVGIENGMN